LLFASHIGHNVIRKEESAKRGVRSGNISCDAHLLNELLETDVEDDYFEMMPSWCRQVN
jgi:hypothetical protein